jgi:tRNA A37 threonylcarbamoyladenosine dehydratase
MRWNMKTIFDRTQMLLGADTMSMLKKKSVIVFGVGGVGGYVVESLVRAGIYNIAIVDYDIVDITNINRQIIALHSTVGRKKVEVMKERILDINPEADIRIFDEKLTENNIDSFNLKEYSYIVDAIDDVPAKLLLIKTADELNVPIISSMGTGNKFNPNMLFIDDIKKTNTCPLAKVIRKETAKMGIKHLKVLFSTELPHREELPDDGSHTPSSISFVPAAAGLLIGAEVVKDFFYMAPKERAIFGFKLPEKVKVNY